MVDFRITKNLPDTSAITKTDFRTLEIGRWTYLYHDDNKIYNIGKNDDIDLGYHISLCDSMYFIVWEDNIRDCIFHRLKDLQLWTKWI
jgi:hypothetical protein